MRVIHVLKDGSEIEDITGYVVRVKDAEPLYKMIREINRKSEQSQNCTLSGNETGSNN